MRLLLKTERTPPLMLTYKQLLLEASATELQPHREAIATVMISLPGSVFSRLVGLWSGGLCPYALLQGQPS